jgi:hypothetical protein
MILHFNAKYPGINFKYNILSTINKLSTIVTAINAYLVLICLYVPAVKLIAMSVKVFTRHAWLLFYSTH